MLAIRVTEHGGPEVLRPCVLPEPSPGRGEILVRNRAIGVNFVDGSHRAGRDYPVGLPLVPGIEGAGTVESVGPGAPGFAPGDRVGYAGFLGAYAELVVVPADRLFRLPVWITFEEAAALAVQGITAHALVDGAGRVGPRDRVLVQGATGGVARHIARLAAERGAAVCLAASSAEKAAGLAGPGVERVFDCSAPGVHEALREPRGRGGFDIVFDGVGGPTFDLSLGALRSRGTLVVYGLSGGPIPPLDPNRLSGIAGHRERGSLVLTWATMSDYCPDADSLRRRADEVFALVAAGVLKIPRPRVLPLAEAAEAHRLLEGRRGGEKIVLAPDNPAKELP